MTSSTSPKGTLQPVVYPREIATTYLMSLDIVQLVTVYILVRSTTTCYMSLGNLLQPALRLPHPHLRQLSHQPYPLQRYLLQVPWRLLQVGLPSPSLGRTGLEQVR